MELVKTFYENNAQRFSDTRFCLWDAVKDFSSNFKEDDLICDAGCGNGKNIKYFQDKCNVFGFDNCHNLIEICKNKGYNVIHSDILSPPYEDNTFNYIICIAVIHHLDSEEKHIIAINQLMNILKKGGKLLITLWAFESDDYSKKKKFNKGHNFIKFDKNERYYYIYDENMLIQMLKNIKYTYNYYWERGNWNIIFEK